MLRTEELIQTGNEQLLLNKMKTLLKIQSVHKKIILKKVIATCRQNRLKKTPVQAVLTGFEDNVMSSGMQER